MKISNIGDRLYLACGDGKLLCYCIQVNTVREKEKDGAVPSIVYCGTCVCACTTQSILHCVIDIFTRIAVAAIINFVPTSVRLLIEGGYYCVSTHAEYSIRMYEYVH